VEGEWLAWHRRYDSDPQLIGRLPVVQGLLRDALDRAAPGPVRLLSLCAGDGRDVLGVVPGHPRRPEVRGVLVELDPALAEAARRRAHAAGLDQLTVLTADAGRAESLCGAVPADILLVCGLFGNVRDRGVRNLIAHLPELAAAGATTIWTRGTFAPDLTPAIRDWFQEAGFEELAFVRVPGTSASVGAHRLVGPPRPFDARAELFRFLPAEERPYRLRPAEARP
jgi:hypothetical protein